MENKEPFAHLNVNGERHEMRQDNTSLFRHLGHHAIYDHVFILLPEDRAAYIWNGMEGYDALATAAVENECTLHLNLPEAGDMDQQAFMRYMMRDFETTDTVPEDWDQK